MFYWEERRENIFDSDVRTNPSKIRTSGPINHQCMLHGAAWKQTDGVLKNLTGLLYNTDALERFRCTICSCSSSTKAHRGFGSNMPVAGQYSLVQRNVNFFFNIYNHIDEFYCKHKELYFLFMKHRKFLLMVCSAALEMNDNHSPSTLLQCLKEYLVKPIVLKLLLGNLSSEQSKVFERFAPTCILSSHDHMNGNGELEKSLFVQAPNISYCIELTKALNDLEKNVNQQPEQVDRVQQYVDESANEPDENASEPDDILLALSHWADVDVSQLASSVGRVKAENWFLTSPIEQVGIAT